MVVAMVQVQVLAQELLHAVGMAKKKNGRRVASMDSLPCEEGPKQGPW